MKKILFLVLFFLAICTARIFAQDAQEIIKNVQDKYGAITDAKATFSQSIKYSSGKVEKSSGTFYIKKEEKYRIETNNSIIVTDGVTSWSYNKKRNQVLIDNYKPDGNTFSPNKFLFKYPENFYSDLEGSETINGVECYAIKLTPRNKGAVKSAKIWVGKNDNLIRKLTLTTSESTSTYTLKKITLDAGLSNSKFTFDPLSEAPGAEVVDLR